MATRTIRLRLRCDLMEALRNGEPIESDGIAFRHGDGTLSLDLGQSLRPKSPNAYMDIEVDGRDCRVSVFHPEGEIASITTTPRPD